MAGTDAYYTIHVRMGDTYVNASWTANSYVPCAREPAAIAKAMKCAMTKSGTNRRPKKEQMTILLFSDSRQKQFISDLTSSLHHQVTHVTCMQASNAGMHAGVGRRRVVSLRWSRLGTISPSPSRYQWWWWVVVVVLPTFAPPYSWQFPGVSVWEGDELIIEALGFDTGHKKNNNYLVRVHASGMERRRRAASSSAHAVSHAASFPIHGRSIRQRWRCARTRRETLGGTRASARRARMQ